MRDEIAGVAVNFLHIFYLNINEKYIRQMSTHLHWNLPISELEASLGLIEAGCPVSAVKADDLQESLRLSISLSRSSAGNEE